MPLLFFETAACALNSNWLLTLQSHLTELMRRQQEVTLAPARSRQNIFRCCPHLWGRWTGVMEKQTVWNWLPRAFLLKARTELNHLDWSGNLGVGRPRSGGHAGGSVNPFCLTNACPAWGALTIVNSLLPGEPPVPSGVVLLMCEVPWHGLSPGRLWGQLQLPGQSVLCLSWCFRPGKKVQTETWGGSHLDFFLNSGSRILPGVKIWVLSLFLSLDW